MNIYFFFFFQAEDGIRDKLVTGVQTCALPIWLARRLTSASKPAPAAFSTQRSPASTRSARRAPRLGSIAAAASGSPNGSPRLRAASLPPPAGTIPSAADASGAPARPAAQAPTVPSPPMATTTSTAPAAWRAARQASSSETVRCSSTSTPAARRRSSTGGSRRAERPPPAAGLWTSSASMGAEALLLARLRWSRAGRTSRPGLRVARGWGRGLAGGRDLAGAVAPGGARLARKLLVDRQVVLDHHPRQQRGGRVHRGGRLGAVALRLREELLLQVAGGGPAGVLIGGGRLLVEAEGGGVGVAHTGQHGHVTADVVERRAVEGGHPLGAAHGDVGQLLADLVDLGGPAARPDLEVLGLELAGGQVGGGGHPWELLGAGPEDRAELVGLHPHQVGEAAHVVAAPAHLRPVPGGQQRDSEHDHRQGHREGGGPVPRLAPLGDLRARRGGRPANGPALAALGLPLDGQDRKST